MLNLFNGLNKKREAIASLFLFNIIIFVNSQTSQHFAKDHHL